MKLVSDIRAAFDGVRFPIDQPADWHELDDETLIAASIELSDMGPTAFRYFLPALLTRALQGHRTKSLSYRLALALDLVFTRPADVQRAGLRVAGLSMEQCRVLEEAIIALDYLGQDLARRGLKWIELRRGDIDSARTWWEHLHDRHSFAAELCRVIERAFDGVPPPDDEHLTLYQAEAADHRAYVDRSRDALGRWQDLPDQHVLDCQWALPWLDAQGMRHYLPAIMTYVLRTSADYTEDGWHAGPVHLSQKDWPWLTFLPDGHRKARLALSLSLFNREQRRALGQFLWFQESNPSLRAAWFRLMEAERDETRADWLDILSGGPHH